MGKGDDFELVIKEICSKLSKKERINARVSSKVPMLGDDGATHEIDVLYSFEHFGISYLVGIECKNWKSNIDVGALRNFDYKLNRIGGINGIFISAESKFQNGAHKVSEFNGIKLVKYDEFDNYAKSDYIKYLKPDFNTIGDPFWMLMNKNGRTSIEQNSTFYGGTILFNCKKIAQSFKNEFFKDYANIVVVGVSQEHLLELKELSKCKSFNVYLKNINFEIMKLTQWDIDLYLR